MENMQIKGICAKCKKSEGNTLCEINKQVKETADFLGATLISVNKDQCADFVPCQGFELEELRGKYESLDNLMDFITDAIQKAFDDGCKYGYKEAKEGKCLIESMKEQYKEQEEQKRREELQHKGKGTITLTAALEEMLRVMREGLQEEKGNLKALQATKKIFGYDPILVREEEHASNNIEILEWVIPVLEEARAKE
jgi:hypothetical protein